MQMISQAYIIIYWLKHYGKRICSLVCVIRAVISLGVILHLAFFNLMINGYMINGYMPLIEIFLFSSFTYYYFFYIKILFSLTTAYDIPFFTDSHNNLFSFVILLHYKCQSKMKNLSFISNNFKGL